MGGELGCKLGRIENNRKQNERIFTNIGIMPRMSVTKRVKIYERKKNGWGSRESNKLESMGRRKQNIKTAKLTLDLVEGELREGKISVVVIRVLGSVGYPYGLGIGGFGLRAARALRLEVAAFAACEACWVASMWYRPFPAHYCWLWPTDGYFREF